MNSEHFMKSELKILSRGLYLPNWRDAATLESVKWRLKFSHIIAFKLVEKAIDKL